MAPPHDPALPTELFSPTSCVKELHQDGLIPWLEKWYPNFVIIVGSQRQWQLQKLITEEKMAVTMYLGLSLMESISVAAQSYPTPTSKILSNYWSTQTQQNSQPCQEGPMNSTSCQVYIELKGATIPESVGDLIFFKHPSFPPTNWQTSIPQVEFSIYYPDTRPHRKDPRYSIVASINAKWQDWGELTDMNMKRQRIDLRGK